MSEASVGKINHILMERDCHNVNNCSTRDTSTSPQRQRQRPTPAAAALLAWQLRICTWQLCTAWRSS